MLCIYIVYGMYNFMYMCTIYNHLSVILLSMHVYFVCILCMYPESVSVMCIMYINYVSHVYEYCLNLSILVCLSVSPFVLCEYTMYYCVFIQVIFWFMLCMYMVSLQYLWYIYYCIHLSIHPSICLSVCLTMHVCFVCKLYMHTVHLSRYILCYMLCVCYVCILFMVGILLYKYVLYITSCLSIYLSMHVHFVCKLCMYAGYRRMG